jgi:hypothetical protein
MGKRAAVVFMVFAIGLVQLFLGSTPPTQFFALAPAPTMITGASPRVAAAPLMMVPRTKTLHNIEVDEHTKTELLRYLDATDPQNVQRTVLVSLFLISKKKAIGQHQDELTINEVLAEPASEAAIRAAAYEVFFIARDLFGGPVKTYVDSCMKRVMLTTTDAAERLDILDACFGAFPEEYKDTPVEEGLRLFRMLLAPQTANVASAKTEVRHFTEKLNKDTAASVERWMRSTEAGQPEFISPSDFAEDCLTVGWDAMDVWMPLMRRKKHLQARTAEDCLLFEEALRNYRAVARDLQSFDL